MSSKKGPGRFVAAHQTEAARRALIQPVPCWELKWIIPPGMNSSSTLRLKQWVKTDKKQEFSDDEDESMAPLAPLPPEPAEGEEEEEEEDEKEGSTAPVASGVTTPLPAETSMRGVPGLDTPISGSMTPAAVDPPNPINLANRLTASVAKPHPLSTSFVPDEMETNEASIVSPTGQDMMEGDPGLLETLNMEMGGMDGLDDENAGAYMDILNSGDLNIGDDILNQGLEEEGA